MVAILTVLGGMLTAFVLAVIASKAVSTVAPGKYLNVAVMFVVAIIVASMLSEGMIGFTAITLSPLLVPLILVCVFAILSPLLAKWGYLGKEKKWMYEMDTDDNTVQAALLLLDDDEMQEVVDVSTDSEDFRQNLLKAAGLEDYEAPGLDY